MSRLIVRGLPIYLTEDKLKEHFLQKGNVTDVKLMKKRNGESRRFAFIGYKSTDDADAAVRYFDNSFINTSRISVEVAKTFSDPTVPMSARDQRKLQYQKLREREERLKEEEERRQLKKHKTKSKIDQEIESNPRLQEFMAVVGPGGKSWANDSLADGSGAPSTKALEEALEGTVTEKSTETPQIPEFNIKENASDDEYEDFNKKEEEEEEEEEMIPLADVEKQQEEMEENEDSKLAKDEGVSDLEWLQQRRVRMVETKEQQARRDAQEAANKEKLNSKKSAPLKQNEPEKKDEQQVIIDKIKETGRLFIRNILYTSTEEDFRNLFTPYGELEEVHIAIDTRTGKSKGFVYIQFKDLENAVNAYKVLDKEIFQGRLLHILPADKKKDHRLDEFDIQNLPLKKQRELKKKNQAAKSQFSWNSLYMNQDAVLESVANKLGVSKSQLIDAQSSDSAVKQALAEAHVIGDVRKYFENKGVDLTSFNKKERDDRVILVKNFAFGTSMEELGDLFSQYGEVKRMLMPPAGTIAIVEFRDSPSARAAFTKLAYKRLGKSILYLEKGPKDLFTREPEQEEAVDVKDTQAVEAKVSAKEVLEEEETPEDIDGPTISVFVKNLNFSTTTAQLTEAFKSLPGFAVAVVKTKDDPKKGLLSMGFGFVEFRTKEDADKAIAVMDGHILDGHKLQLKLSNRGSSSTKKVKSGKKSTKIIIKNLPFEASRKDIVELFGAFGQIKSARVPKKFDRSARGFAFVEFGLLKEAENAMNLLEGVHLLGRRLVMDYAEKDAEDAEAEIERMTAKVQQQYATQQLAAQRLTGKGKLDIEEEEEF